MSLFCKLLLYAFLQVFVICSAHAEMVGEVAFDHSSFCFAQSDIDDVAAGHMAGKRESYYVWQVKVVEHKCFDTELPYKLTHIVSDFTSYSNAPAHVVGLDVFKDGWYPVFAIWLNDVPGIIAITWKPDGTETPEQMEWFKNAQTTPEVRTRLGWTSCCASADRFKTTFVYDDKNGQWFFYVGESLRLIPNDVIHTEVDDKMPAQLKVEGVLFIVGNVIACFWPPQTGG